MARKIILAIIGVIGVGVLFSLMGGSLIWMFPNFGKAMQIDGHAPIVRADAGQDAAPWSNYGGDEGGGRYTSADEITPQNVKTLKVAWSYQTKAFEGREAQIKRAAFQSTPILVADSLVFCTPFNDVIAIDPGAGAERWRYDPKVDLDARPANDFTCRGVAHWSTANDESAPCQSRIFSGTADAQLIALDAKTGALCKDFGENGIVQIEPSLPLRWPGEYQFTSPPVIVGDVVIIGSSISDNLRAHAPAGTVHAFDVRTGAPKWTFDPVPGPEDPKAYASWAPQSAERAGHANVWAPISADSARGLVFLPTSSASPDFFGGARAGDNLYTNSVVALRAETGDVAWHFQTVHHDVWDYDVPAQPGAYTVWRDGKAHDVIAQITKTGFVFVLDRDTGAPFLPVEERPVPQDGAPGESLSPTQPFPVATPAIVPSKVSPKDAFGITFWDKGHCAAQLKALKREGLFTPPSEQGTLIYPFNGGGGNWGGAAFDPARNLLVVNMSNAGHEVRLFPSEETESVRELSHETEVAPMEGVPYGVSRRLLASPLGLPCTPPPWGVLAGVDLASGEIVWRKTLGTTRDLAPLGIALKTGTPNFGGPMISKGGLIFIGAAMDDYIRAFDVETGEELWKGRLPAGGQATPMSYEWQGRQYVVIAAGGHAKSRTKSGDYVMAYALPKP